MNITEAAYVIEEREDIDYKNDSGIWVRGTIACDTLSYNPMGKRWFLRMDDGARPLLINCRLPCYNKKRS